MILILILYLSMILLSIRLLCELAYTVDVMNVQNVCERDFTSTITTFISDDVNVGVYIRGNRLHLYNVLGLLCKQCKL